jgi:hypothetical protein
VNFLRKNSTHVHDDSNFDVTVVTSFFFSIYYHYRTAPPPPQDLPFLAPFFQIIKAQREPIMMTVYSICRVQHGLLNHFYHEWLAVGGVGLS